MLALKTDKCSEGMSGLVHFSLYWHQQHSQNCVYISHSSTLAILECAVVMEDTSTTEALLTANVASLIPRPEAGFIRYICFAL